MPAGSAEKREYQVNWSNGGAGQIAEDSRLMQTVFQGQRQHNPNVYTAGK
jgi:hypothetical protein